MEVVLNKTVAVRRGGKSGERKGEEEEEEEEGEEAVNDCFSLARQEPLAQQSVRWHHPAPQISKGYFWVKAPLCSKAW